MTQKLQRVNSPWAKNLHFISPKQTFNECFRHLLISFFFAKSVLHPKMNCLAFCTIGFSSVHLIDWLTINWLEIIKLRPSWFYWLDSSVGYAWHSCLESGKERNFNTIWGVLGPFNRKRFENFGKKIKGPNQRILMSNCGSKNECSLRPLATLKLVFLESMSNKTTQKNSLCHLSRTHIIEM